MTVPKRARKRDGETRLGLIRRADDTKGGDISQYQALTTALAATVGVGNIVGVATAIHMGGPGALFWMWVTGVFGMASKYSEAFLGVRFRTTDAKGEISGGPQYYLQRGIPGGIGKFLALFFCVAAIIASFVLAIPIARLARVARPLRAVLVTGSSLLYAVPSLALFVILPIILATGIRDPLNVIVALTLYGLALLVPATADALDAVDARVLDAATATGSCAMPDMEPAPVGTLAVFSTAKVRSGETACRVGSSAATRMSQDAATASPAPRNGRSWRSGMTGRSG